ncbi:MAG: hypothetical protein JSS63_07140 [Bacteroidetes bacterium]|nr:hypothetical protein [Bacteroidota bacterium]
MKKKIKQLKSSSFELTLINLNKSIISLEEFIENNSEPPKAESRLTKGGERIDVDR